LAQCDEHGEAEQGGTADTFRWGVWGSLSRQNFEKLVTAYDDPDRIELAQEFYHGITAERVKEIMTKRLREIG